MVDDQKEDRDAMRLGAEEVVESIGIGTVDEAQDAEDAIRLLGEHHYDVVVADLQLTPEKKKEGWDVLQYAKKRYTDTKVIIVTAYPEPPVEARSIALGAFAYMDKMQGDSFIECIRNAVSSALWPSVKGSGGIDFQ